MSGILSGTSQSGCTTYGGARLSGVWVKERGLTRMFMPVIQARPGGAYNFAIADTRISSCAGLQNNEKLLCLHRRSTFPFT